MSAITLRSQATTAVAGSVFFWAVAAVAVAGTHRFLEARSPASCLAVSVLLIVSIAFAYMRVAARGATMDQALFVGVAWAFLAVIAESVDVTHSTPHYPLLGSPAHEAFRDLMVIAWIAAPALFARRRS